MKSDSFPYDYFDKFTQAFFIDKKSFLTNDSIDICSFNSWDKLINKINAKKADELPEEINNMTDEERLILLHAYWLWYFPFGFKGENNKLKKLFGDIIYDSINKEFIKNETEIAGPGGFGMQIHSEVIWILNNIFKKYWGNYHDKETLKNNILKGLTENDEPVSSRNLILHILNPDKYEPIAKNDDKQKIAKAFSKVLKINGGTPIDEQLSEIRKSLDLHDSFYSEPYVSLWKDNIMSPTGKLEYKKAMILYGPPGTGKTYTAIEMAKRLLAKQYIKKGENVKDNLKYLQDTSDEVFLENDEHIKYLQFHINYNYENFIAGQIIKDSKVETKPGFIFDVINDANENKDMPFVVILDEINRTDISRVFGELFTAIEKRGKDVVLSIPDSSDDKKQLVLNVPENIYFIGTMNEIDFSLERVDFALRRRFIWEYCGYNKDALYKIINNRLRKYGETINQNTIKEYIESCSRLNEEIKNNPYLGESYHIGHAFFAEIADIYHHLDNTDNNKRRKNAKRILWEISIKPTLDAYCGSMDKSEKKAKEGDFYKAFFKFEELKDEESEESKVD